MPDNDNIEVPQAVEEEHAPLDEQDTSFIAPPELNPTSTPRSKDSFSVLTRIPLDVQPFRERVFNLDTTQTFTAQEWEKYWPFIDNVWCLHNRMDTPAGLTRGHTEKFWGGCRLQRKWDHQTSNPPPKGIRNRVRRETGTCQAKFKLTVLPDGSRVLERSTKDGHSHDIDHIDAIKRNSGVRSLVLDPFFNSWEPATIMAYLRDPDHFVDGRDMLTEAGGKYLERREIMNIFSQNLRKLYPGIDVSAIKKEQDKYKSMKTCNAKGCNRSFPDGKALMAHRKQDHPPGENRSHNHAHRQYTCPMRGCHRKKKSKGFPSQLALREHQAKMEHWGSGMFHGEDGPTPCPPVHEGDVFEEAPADAGAMETDQVPNAGAASTEQEEQYNAVPQPDDGLGQDQAQFSVPQQPLPNPDHSLLPLIAQGVSEMAAQAALVPIDPAMHSQPPPQHHNQAAAQPGLAQGGNVDAELQERQAMMERYQQLEEEMNRLKGQLFA